LQVTANHWPAEAAAWIRHGIGEQWMRHLVVWVHSMAIIIENILDHNIERPDSDSPFAASLIAC